MCFLKLGDPLAPCDHEECKKTLQALQLSSCLYSNANKANQMIFKPQPQYVPKRPRPENMMENNNSEDCLMKKIKTDNNTLNDENGKTSKLYKNLLKLIINILGNIIEKKDENSGNTQNNEECLMKLLAMQQQQNKPQMPQNNMSHNFMNMKPAAIQNQNIPMMAQQNNDNQLLTFLLMQNNQNNKNVNNMPNAVFHDVSQNLQDPMLNIQLQMNAFHNNNNNNTNGGNNGNIYDNNTNLNQNVLLSKDFLNKIYTIITMQHKLITEIKEKNNQLFDGFNKLSQEFNDFKYFSFFL